MNDANSNPLRLGEIVWLKTRFGNTLFMITFTVAERLAVDDIVGKSSMTRHIDYILFREQKIKFAKGTVPIVGQ